MKTILRTIAAVFAGLLVLFLLVVAVELFSAVVHPLPADSQGTAEEICRHVERYPPWVLAVCIPMWGCAAFAGVWTARNIGNLFSAATVSLLLLAGLAGNLAMLPYPLWFKIACLVVVPCAVFAGGRPWTSLRTTSPAVGKEVRPG